MNVTLKEFRHEIVTDDHTRVGFVKIKMMGWLSNGEIATGHVTMTQELYDGLKAPAGFLGLELEHQLMDAGKI
jgi:hypothetical protein